MTPDKIEVRSLYEYVTPEAEERIRAALVTIAERKSELARIESIEAQVRADLASAPTSRARQNAADADAAAAALLGEPAPSAPAEPERKPVDVLGLQQALDGLERRIREAKENVRAAEAAHRTVTSQAIFKEAVPRWEADMVAAAQRFTELWVVGDSIGMLSDEIRGSNAPQIISPTFWGMNRLYGADSAKELPALSRASHQTDRGPILFDALETRAAQVVFKATNKFRSDMVRATGNWPFGRNR